MTIVNQKLIQSSDFVWIVCFHLFGCCDVGIKIVDCPREEQEKAEGQEDPERRVDGGDLGDDEEERLRDDMCPSWLYFRCFVGLASVMMEEEEETMLLLSSLAV